MSPRSIQACSLNKAKKETLTFTKSTCICQQVVARGGMVDVATIQAFDHELTREPKVVANLQGLLVDVLRRKVFRDATVVGVAQLYLVVLVVEEVVHVHIVHIALDVLQVDVVLGALAAGDRAVVLPVFVAVAVFFVLFFLVRLVLDRFFEPGV